MGRVVMGGGDGEAVDGEVGVMMLGKGSDGRGMGKECVKGELVQV